MRSVQRWLPRTRYVRLTQWQHEMFSGTSDCAQQYITVHEFDLCVKRRCVMLAPSCYISWQLHTWQEKNYWWIISMNGVPNSPLLAVWQTPWLSEQIASMWTPVVPGYKDFISKPEKLDDVIAVSSYLEWDADQARSTPSKWRQPQQDPRMKFSWRQRILLLPTMSR